MKKITAIIPAGGPGGGMYPLTAGMPKSLIPIGTKPMLVHILENLDPDIFDKIIIVADKYFPMIKEYVNAFKHITPIKISYRNLFVPPPQQLLALENELSNPFAIYYTDIITDKIDWKDGMEKYIKLRKKNKSTSGLLYVSRHYPLTIGIVRQDPNDENYIEEFIEKPGKIMRNFVNMAVAIFDKSIIKHIKPEHISLFGESVPDALLKGKRFTFLEHGEWKHFQLLGTWVDNQTEFYSKKRNH